MCGRSIERRRLKPINRPICVCGSLSVDLITSDYSMSITSAGNARDYAISETMPITLELTVCIHIDYFHQYRRALLVNFFTP